MTLYTGIDPLALAGITVYVVCAICSEEICPIDGLPHHNHVRNLIKDHLAFSHGISNERDEEL